MTKDWVHGVGYSPVCQCFLFHSGQVFHQLVCPLTVVLRQIFFNLTTLFSYPVFFSFFYAPLDVVHFLVFLRSFRLESFLPQFSPFVAQIKNFCSVPEFFLLTMFAKDLMGCFNHSVLKMVIIESTSVSSLSMMVRGANFPPIIA